jgi:signal transduction histidine kinase
MLAVVWLHALHVRRAANVARAAHELRGPLCAATLALHGAAGDARRLAAAEAELRRAGLALDDLAGHRPVDVLAPLDLSPLVEELAVAWRPMAARHGAGLRLAVPSGGVLVRGDRLRLAQALANLVANAAEHGVGDVLVAMRASATHVRVEVRDGGPGPSPGRVAAARRGGGRTAGARGHGLVVAARVATRHGGKLFVVPAGRAQSDPVPSAPSVLPGAACEPADPAGGAAGGWADPAGGAAGGWADPVTGAGAVFRGQDAEGACVVLELPRLGVPRAPSRIRGRGALGAVVARRPRPVGRLGGR